MEIEFSSAILTHTSNYSQMHSRTSVFLLLLTRIQKDRRCHVLMETIYNKWYYLGKSQCADFAVCSIWPKGIFSIFGGN